jgi:ribosomal protein L37AE/L43A
MSDDCSHKNAYKDDFLGEWHCDDCGATLDGPPEDK